MYNEYYGFQQPPFNLTPDPRFLFFTEKHREAFNHMLFGITQRKGFIQITGDVGAGKTTICRALLDELGPRYRTALILNPCLNKTQLLRTICREFELKLPMTTDKNQYLDLLNEFLFEQAALGREVVLIIDEAQNLSNDLLEQVRLLSNLETDDRKLLQIVLLGQPELRDRLNARALRQLRQRITVRYHLRPLSRAEIGPYIAHRLQHASRLGGRFLSTAGHSAGSGGSRAFGAAFTASAIWQIHRYTRGVPRLINAVCDKTLLYGFVTGRKTFNWLHVRRSIRELEGLAA